MPAREACFNTSQWVLSDRRSLFNDFTTGIIRKGGPADPDLTPLEHPKGALASKRSLFNVRNGQAKR
jgi:hypothetical protein